MFLPISLVEPLEALEGLLILVDSLEISSETYSSESLSYEVKLCACG